MDARDGEERSGAMSLWRRIVTAPQRRVGEFEARSPEVAIVAKVAAGLLILCALLLALDAVVG
jgi:hypothetical protein